MEKDSEQVLAKKIAACLVFLKKKARLIKHEKEVADQLGISSPNLSFAKGSGRDVFEKGWTREKILKAILAHWPGMEIRKVDGEYEAFMPEMGTDPREEGQSQASPESFKSVHHYLYYFRESLKTNSPLVRKGKFVVTQDQEREHAVLTFFDQAGTLVVYEGKKEEPGRTQEIYFWLKRKGVKATRPAFSCLILVPAFDSHENGVIFGTFSAKGPSCGKVILEKCASDEQLEKAFNDPAIDPMITSLLAMQRLEANEGAAMNWKELEATSYKERLNSLAGAYYCYTFNQKQEGISRHKVKINPDGTASLYWQLTSEEYEGFVRISEDRTMLNAFFDFRRELQDHQIRFLLKLDNDPLNALFGVFYGIDKNHNQPMAGKCLFRKTTEPYQDITPDFFEDYGEMEEVDDLANFFLGGDDLHQYCDSPALAMDFFGEDVSENVLYPTDEQENDDGRIAELAGVYRIMFLSTDTKNVVSSLVEIRPNGEFEMKEYKDPSEVSSGEIHVFRSSFLIFSFYQRGEHKHRGEIFFHVGELKRSDFKHLKGGSLLITTRNTFRIGQVALFVCDEAFDSAISYAVPIPYNGQDREKFDRLNREFGNVGRFLMGDTNNLVLPERDPDVELNVKEDFRKIHFAAACFYGQKYVPGSLEGEKFLEKFKAHIKRAIDHGFGLDKEDIEAFNRERQPRGLLTTIPENEWKKIQLKKLKMA